MQRHLQRVTVCYRWNILWYVRVSTSTLTAENSQEEEEEEEGYTRKTVTGKVDNDRKPISLSWACEQVLWAVKLTPLAEAWNNATAVPTPASLQGFQSLPTCPNMFEERVKGNVTFKQTFLFSMILKASSASFSRLWILCKGEKCSAFLWLCSIHDRLAKAQ